MIPNWENPNSYPNPEETSKLQWAWEFLRRNQQYQDTWKNYVATGCKPSRDELFKSFGITTICDPNEEFSSPNVTMLCLSEEEAPEILTWLELQQNPECIDLIKPAALNEVTIKFDLHGDLDRQIDKAAEFLHKFLDSFIKKPLRAPTNLNIKDYPKYLRLLDARKKLDEEGQISNAQFFREIWECFEDPNPVENENPIDKEERRIDALKKNLQEARRLAKAGFRKMASQKYRRGFTDEMRKQFRERNKHLFPGK